MFVYVVSLAKDPVTASRLEFIENEARYVKGEGVKKCAIFHLTLLDPRPSLFNTVANISESKCTIRWYSSF